MSLTNRMAAALRKVRAGYDGSIETFVIPTAEGRALVQEVVALLAEYDAERNPPPAKPKPQVGQRVHCVDTLGPKWPGVVKLVKDSTVVVQLDDGDEYLAMADELEIIPNLPATNTGD